MSLTCHAEIGRVGRGCYRLVCNKCRTRGIWKTTRHTDKRAASTTPHQTAGRPSWTEKSPDTPNTRNILVASSWGCRSCPACRQGSQAAQSRQPCVKSHWLGQVLTVGGLNMPQTNPIWRTAAILKNRKILISSQPIDRLTDKKVILLSITLTFRRRGGG